MASSDKISETRVAAGSSAASLASAHRGVFSRESEFWRIGFDRNAFNLKHTKGLAYIAQLLRFPATEFHVLDLVGGPGGARDADEILSEARSSLPRGDDALQAAGIHVGDLGDAGDMLDEQAKAEYRRRIAALREDLEEAKSLGQVERAERAEGEIEAITAELSRAVGLGGRNRRAASASERARQSVTHAIKSALEKIAENQSQLGAILSRSISTGLFVPTLPILRLTLPGNLDHRPSSRPKLRRRLYRLSRIPRMSGLVIRSNLRRQSPFSGGVELRLLGGKQSWSSCGTPGAARSGEMERSYW